VVSFTLPQGKSLRYPLARRLGGRQSQSVYGAEEKNSQHTEQGIRRAFETCIVRRISGHSRWRGEEEEAGED
jgi:hypothetical protein